MAKTELFARVQPGGVFSVVDQSVTTGSIFWVDSNSTTGANSAGYGQNPDAPFLTLSYALSSDVCTASKGDIIYLMPAHTEACIAAGTITADIAGVKIIGLGDGNLRPSITFTSSANASFLVSAANVTIENLIFDMTGVDSLNNPLNITAAGCTVRKCEFEHGDNGGQADHAIQTDANANDLIVEDCYFFGSSDSGTDCAIYLIGGDSAKIRRNQFFGYYTTTSGAIFNDTTAATNLLIENNVIYNRTAVSTNAIAVDGSTTGVIQGNTMAILSGSTPITAAGMMWGGGNNFTNAVATEGVGLLTVDSALNFIGYDNNNNAAATSNVAANENGSILERLEQIQEAINNGTGTSIGSNKSIVDLLGTTGAALVDDALSVVGILGVNDADNAFASSSVAADADGSILERLEYIQKHTTAQTPTTYVPGLGYRVSKIEDTNAAGDDLFTVTGKILITGLFGEVTDTLGAGVVADYVLALKTSGEALCAATTITSDTVGTMYSLSGDVGDTLNAGSTPTTRVADINGKGPVHLVVGLAGGSCTISSTHTDTGTAGDAITWLLFYLPLEASATVAAAT